MMPQTAEPALDRRQDIRGLFEITRRPGTVAFMIVFEQLLKAAAAARCPNGIVSSPPLPTLAMVNFASRGRDTSRHRRCSLL
jgi:hypothetical protein